MSGRRQRPERLIALFVTVFWAAVVFAVDGVISVITDSDPVRGGVGPYYSILAFVAAGLMVWLLLSGSTRSRQPATGAIAAAASVYLVFLLIALPFGFELVVEQALSPFVIVAAALAAVAVVGTWLVLRSVQLRGNRN